MNVLRLISQLIGIETLRLTDIKLTIWAHYGAFRPCASPTGPVWSLWPKHVPIFVLGLKHMHFN